MALSDEVRRLERGWQNETAWPKRLEWLEISGLRGWSGLRIEFQFPIVAISGENGTGKSSIIQAAASIYRNPSAKSPIYASEFFPSTAWDSVSNALIKFSVREGSRRVENSIRKPTERWKGNVDRPERPVEYFDLSRVLPISGRAGYTKIVKSKHKEASAVPFESDRLNRLKYILGHEYSSARMAISDIDSERAIPVLQSSAFTYSGYHQGQGETTITELIQADLPKTGLILIDEIESSLHPRAQRRLIRDLASVARDRELQIIVTTHSPYILEELPERARMQIFWNGTERKIMTGVSAQFAMAKMDDEPHPECEVYVEDTASKVLLSELLSQKAKNLVGRVQITTFGAASVGYQLGQMVDGRKFFKPTAVFLDGDCKEGVGCHVLPGSDAPERTVYHSLKAIAWRDLWTRLKRSLSEVSSACESAMMLGDHHDWTEFAAKQLALSPEVLWHSLCGEWAEKCVSESDAKRLANYVEDRISDYMR